MKKLRYFLLFVLISGAFVASAQHSTTLYYMSGVPQKTFVNPALRPESRGFMGTPGISMMQLHVGNTGFGFNDVITRNDTSFTVDIDKMLSGMPAVSRMYTSLYYQPVAFGFSFLRRGYLTFAMAPVMSVEFFYPRDLFGMIWKGNGHEDYLGKRISFDGTGVEMSLTNEISVGYSHQITKRLTLGMRYRYINGLVNLHTEKFLAGITTDADDFGMTFDLDARIHASAPLINFDSLSSFDLGGYSTKELLESGLTYLDKNKGQAYDFGFSYRLMQRFFLSGSVNNIGSITWAGNPFTLQSQGSFAFNGIDLTSMITGDSTEEFSVEDLLDSVLNQFTIDTLRNTYTQVLTPSVNLGAAFYLTRDDAIGFLWRNQFYQGNWFPKMTLSYNHRFGRILSISATYDIEAGSYKSIGAGIALKLGPFQYYLITDNALAFAYPLDTRQVSFLTGINWIFGSKPRRESEASL